MINKTPLMTNKGYNINDAKVKIAFPKEYIEFKNIEIASENIELKNQKNRIEQVTYGMGKEAIENIEKYCNHNIEGKTLKKANLNIKYNFNQTNPNLISFLDIKCEHDLNITILYKSEDNQTNFLNTILKISANNKAKVNVNIINLLNKKSNNCITVESIVEDESRTEINIVDLGSLNSLQNIYGKVSGKKAEFKINSMYMGNEEETKDLNYITHLIGESTKVKIDVIGSLNDESKKSFKGTIDFKKGCKKAIGEEKEHCVLLSKAAISKALPMLLCNEEDVEGAHSSSSRKCRTRTNILYNVKRTRGERSH